MHARLIFAESHYDPITGEILDKLVAKILTKHPEWKISFLDEYPIGTTIERRLEMMLEKARNWQSKAALIQEGFGFSLVPENLTHPIFLNPIAKPLVDLVKRVFADVTFHPLLLTLQENHIEYKGMDMDLMKLAGGDADKADALGVMLTNCRDKVMADELIKQDGVVLARVGLAHAEGLNKRLRAQLASDAVGMYNVFSVPPLDHKECAKIEKPIRAGEKDFITPIDATGKTDAEIDALVDGILANLEKRELSLAKVTPSEPVTESKASAASNLGLFKRVESRPMASSSVDLFKGDEASKPVNNDGGLLAPSASP